jgi:GAF domain-containing protein
MEQKSTKIGILGGREEDLALLSELHKQEAIDIIFLYEELEDAIGIEIAEILGIARFTQPKQLEAAREFDYLVICEPRERFEEAMSVLSGHDAKLLSSSEARTALCGEKEEQDGFPDPHDSVHYSIEDTLLALEKLFDRRSLLKFLLDLSIQHSNASTGSIMLYSPAANDLYIGYASGLSERVLKGTRQRLGEGIAGRVALEKRAQLFRLKREDTLYAADRERVDIATAISVPLLWENQLLGVLNVSTSRGERELDGNDFERLKKMSRRISKVLSGSLRVQEIQVRHQEQSLRTTVGELTEKPAEFQEKVFSLSNYLSELLGIDTVEIYLNTHEGDWFLLGGSNNRFASESEKVRCEKGVLSRCFLEQRPVILRETTDGARKITDPYSALVFYPIHLIKPLGVLVTEFSERHKLEEYLAVKDSVGLEIARFISAEIRSRALTRELSTMGKISEAAPGLLNSRNVTDLCETISRTVANLFECDYVSTRLKTRSSEAPFSHSCYLAPGTASDLWQREDETVFRKLAKKREPFSEAHLTFEPAVGRRSVPYDSLLALPIFKGGELIGGIVAYNKHSADPLEESVFSDFDRSVIDQLLAFALPMLETVSVEDAVPEDGTEQAYDKLLENNRVRLLKACEREIQRSDRYHYPFTFLLFTVKPLRTLFEEDYQHALELVEEMTNGIRTRTRKTDYLAWISKDTFALLSLEGSRRVRFLTSRILLYLDKDLTAFGAQETEEPHILLGQADFPGSAGTAEQLLREAEQNRTPHSAE